MQSVWKRVVVGWGVFLIWPAASSSSPIPTLRIDRQVWALEENVFFWSGVSSDGGLKPEHIEDCGVVITAPDGSIFESPALWPADGNPERGWSGGTGLAAAKTTVGEYRVRAFCGEQAVEGSFEVRDLGILDQISVRFEIEPGCGGDPADETVVWSVENRSRYPLVVAPPGSLMVGGIGFQLLKRGSRAACAAFVPPESLGVEPPGVGRPMVENLTWENLRWLKVDRVAAGETGRRSFCLSVLAEGFCQSVWPPEAITVSATTQVLVGPRRGPWAEAGPFRVFATLHHQLPQLDSD